MQIIKRVERPRELKWYQAGAMLYGDWGTSKAYVLGIAFALSGHASWFYLGLTSLLTALVGVCYIIICRVHPDGGGVYSALRNRSRLLAVIGALLLIADYTVTASLSALSAFQYFNVPYPEYWAIAAILIVGAMNWIGPSKGGSVAAIIGIFASVSAFVLFAFTLPHLPHVELTRPTGTPSVMWANFVGIVLALSGVEAIANMTGIMVHPVERTSRRAIWPVLLEVSVLTFLLGIAMNAIPNLSGHTEDMLRALGRHYVAPWFGEFISITFAFLLLSAVNTAMNDLVSIQFSMGRDKELPRIFTRLNRFGMPSLALVIAALMPALVLIFVHDLVQLAALYAIGVVGAITVNLGASATNRKLSLKKHERAMLFFGAIVLFLIEVTIAVQKHRALVFVLIILGTGLALRAVSKKFVVEREPEAVPSTEVLTVSEAKEIGPLYKSSFLIAVRKLNPHLLEEAARLVKGRSERSVYLCVVEQAPPTQELPSELEPSAESLEFLAKVEQEMQKQDITVIPVWQMGDEPGKQIAYAARELNVQTVVIGTTERSALVSMFRGDVLRTLARHLPQRMPFGRDELTLELTIDRLAFGGDGIATHEGKIYFVEGALPGERVTARVTQDKKNFGRAEIVQILKASPQRIAPPCKYVTHCGGCQYQHVEYRDELRFKEEQVAEVFERQLGIGRALVRPIAHGEHAYGYRNSVTLHPTSTDFKRPQRLGFIGRDNASPVVMDHCLLADERLKPVFAEKRLVPPKKTRLTYRIADNGTVIDDRSELYYRVNVAGAPVLTSSEGFFQNNLEVTGLVVATLRDWVRETKPRIFLDLYAGVGTFGLSVADDVREVHAFEENTSSLECLKINFKESTKTLSGVHAGRVEHTFPRFFTEEKRDSAMIFMDPPRQGIAAGFAKFLAEAPADELIYLSCDLPTLTRDLRIVTGTGGYRITAVAPFDMFPRTKHIETLVRLRKKNS